jgi:phosphinothricin acetyltransferase
MIRTATLDDCVAISAIFNDALLNTTSVYAYEPETVADRQRWLAEKQNAGFPVLVDERDDQVVGFATFGPFRLRPAYRYTAEHSLYVDVAWRNQGIGEGLLLAIIDEAKRYGIKTLVGGIDSANTDSRRFHTKHGFVYQGTIPQAGYKFGRWLDLCFYTLSLPGPKHPVES